MSLRAPSRSILPPCSANTHHIACEHSYHSSYGLHATNIELSILHSGAMGAKVSKAREATSFANAHKATIKRWRSEDGAAAYLANGDKIDIIVPSLESRDAQARPDVSIQLQLLSQRQVQRPVALANGCSHGAFQSDAIRLRLNGEVRTALRTPRSELEKQSHTNRTRTESKFSRVIRLFVLSSTTVATYWGSHLMGTFAALKIFLIESAISGPIPSPGQALVLRVNVASHPVALPELLERERRSLTWEKSSRDCFAPVKAIA